MHNNHHAVHYWQDEGQLAEFDVHHHDCSETTNVHVYVTSFIKSGRKIDDIV